MMPPSTEDNPTVVKPGTLLVKTEPFVYTGNLKCNVTVCDTCLKTDGGEGEEGALLRCSSCKMVHYCNKVCQKKGWALGHKHECKGMILHEWVPGHLPRLLLRLIVKLQDGKDHFEEIKMGNSTTKRRFRDLVSHSEEIRNDKAAFNVVDRTITSAKLLLLPQKMKMKMKVPDDDELLEMCGRIFCNSYIIGDGTQGYGLYLAASIFNHSCDEMAVRTYEGTTMFVRNIVEIPTSMPLDKVTLNYIDSMKPTQERKKNLMEDYYFDCQCERCRLQLFDKEMRSIICPNLTCKKELYIEELSKPCGGCGDLVDKEVVAEVLETENFILEEKNADRFIMTWDLDTNDNYIEQMKKAHFSDTHWLMVSMLTKGFDAAYRDFDFKKAYEYGPKYITGVRRYLHPCQLELAQALVRMAWTTLLLHKMDKLEEADLLTTEAESLMKISHGQESSHFKATILELRKSIDYGKLRRNFVGPDPELDYDTDEDAEDWSRGS